MADIAVLASLIWDMFFTVCFSNYFFVGGFIAFIFVIVLAYHRASPQVWVIIMIPLMMFIAGMGLIYGGGNAPMSDVLFRLGIIVIITVILTVFLTSMFKQ